MKAFERYMSQFPNYRPALFEDAQQYLSTIHIKAGDFFLKEGKVSRQIAFIKKGLLRLYYLNDGHEMTTCFCKENTITCSYKSLIQEVPSELSIQAIESSELIVFTYNDLQSLYQKDLFCQQVGRLAAENEYINAECHSRFISDLSATEKYKQILTEDPDLIKRTPLNYLASYLHIAPETLSRIRSKMKHS